MFFKSFILICSKFLGAFLGLIIGILLARELGSTNLGQYQVFISTQTIIITLVTLGIGNASIYFINRKEITEKEVVSTFLKIFIPIGLFTSVIFYFIIVFNKGYFGIIDLKQFIVFLIGTVSLILISILRPVFYAKHKIGPVTFINVLPTLILLLGIFILLLEEKLDVSNVLFYWGIGNFFTFLVCLFFHRRNIDFKIKIDNSKIIEIVKYGTKISAANLLVVLISNVSIFFINKLSNNHFSDVGLYSRAIAISSIVFMVPSAVGPLLFAKWSTISNKELLSIEIKRTLRIFNLLVICIITLGIIFSKLIIIILYGEAYLSIQFTLIILLCSLLFQVISEVFNNVLASQGKALQTMYSLLLMLIIIIIANLILVPTYGILGAGISILLGAIVNAFNLNYRVNKSLNMKINFKNNLIVKKADFYELKKLIKK